jgi:hypothetical protein
MIVGNFIKIQLVNGDGEELLLTEELLEHLLKDMSIKVIALITPEETDIRDRKSSTEACA